MEQTKKSEELLGKDSHLPEGEGDFLQSEAWRKFQESAGRKTFILVKDGFSASIAVHKLPIVGDYFYIPRGPVIVESKKLPASTRGDDHSSTRGGKVKNLMQELINLAKKENVGWIRIDPENNELLDIIKKSIESLRQGRIGYEIRKAPHDMQPRENFVLDISKSEEQLLSEMKPKTRYNINLAQKHGVFVRAISKSQFPISKQYEDDFLRLTREMAKRNGIATHPEEYYRKMIESLPSDMLKIYVAEYEGKIVAANLVIFHGNSATYLHGASGAEHRNVMAPFFLQWKAILDAKKAGCGKYDFGGMDSSGMKKSWAGITSFKTGFSPQAKPVEFPGSYDIVINPMKYSIYRGLQRAKSMAYNLYR